MLTYTPESFTPPTEHLSVNEFANRVVAFSDESDPYAGAQGVPFPVDPDSTGGYVFWGDQAHLGASTPPAVEFGTPQDMALVEGMAEQLHFPTLAEVLHTKKDEFDAATNAGDTDAAHKFSVVEGELALQTMRVVVQCPDTLVSALHDERESTVLVPVKNVKAALSKSDRLDRRDEVHVGEVLSLAEPVSVEFRRAPKLTQKFRAGLGRLSTAAASLVSSLDGFSYGDHSTGYEYPAILH